MLKILTAALMLVTTPWLSAWAIEIRIIPPVQTVDSGTIFSVDIITDPETGEALAGGVMALGYDDSVVEILDVAIEPYWDFLPDPGSKTGDGLWEGIGFDVWDNDPADESAVIATITLKAQAAGATQLRVLEASQFFSATVQLLPTFIPASIYVDTSEAVYAGADQDVAEGDTVFFAGSVSDPDLENPDIRWDFGDGGVAAGTLTPTHIYADDGTYTVTLNVTGENGTGGTDSLTVTVDNAGPVIMEVDSPQTVRTGQPVTVSCSFEDPGADTWTADIDYGDGLQETLELGQNKNFAFSHTYFSAGLSSIEVIISDDDGGEDGKALQIGVTGDSDCVRGKGFWSHQFSGKGGRRVDDYTLQAYLDIVNYFSKVFSEEVSLKSFEEASAIFRWNKTGGTGQKNKSMSMKNQALGHLLATWLNFSDGAITYETLVDTDFDNIPETRFAEAIEWVESIFTDPDSNRSDFIGAKVVCESISSMGTCSPSLGIRPAFR